jgi:hypothetical protein
MKCVSGSMSMYPCRLYLGPGWYARKALAASHCGTDHVKHRQAINFRAVLRLCEVCAPVARQTSTFHLEQTACSRATTVGAN